jgi:hypothetical protein
LDPGVPGAARSEFQSTDLPPRGLDPATLERGLALIVEELKDRPYRTRAELGQALADQRLRLAYIVSPERRTPGSHLQWPDAR